MKTAKRKRLSAGKKLRKYKTRNLRSTKCVVVKPQLTKSKERVKDLGEVFTPDFLVEQMLDQFPDDAWEVEECWLEPSCGTGNFILGVLRRKIRLNMERHGLAKSVAILKALNTTYGMDIMADNVRECRSRVFVEIVLPAITRYSEQIAFDMKCKAMCIIKNNIVQTQDSLAEDWNNKWIMFQDLPKDEQIKEIENAKSILKKQQAKKDKVK